MKQLLKQSMAVPALAFVLFFLNSAFTANSEAEATADFGWELLGTRKVNFALDRDVIKVTAREGTFRKLKLQVNGAPLNLRKLLVQYGNGTKDVIEVRHNFARGSGSRIIDLPGGNRVIRDITFYYDTDNRARRRATLRVFGI